MPSRYAAALCVLLLTPVLAQLPQSGSIVLHLDATKLTGTTITVWNDLSVSSAAKLGLGRWTHRVALRLLSCAVPLHPQPNGFQGKLNGKGATVTPNMRQCLTAVSFNSNTATIPYNSTLQPNTNGFSWFAVARQRVTSNMNLIIMQNSAANVGGGNQGDIDYRLLQTVASTQFRTSILNTNNKVVHDTKTFNSYDTSTFQVGRWRAGCVTCCRC
jgi:hypothetical protein